MSAEGVTGTETASTETASTETTGTETTGAVAPDHVRHRRRWPAVAGVLAGTLVVAVVAGGGTYVLTHDEAAPAPVGSGVTVVTGVVTRGNLSDEVRLRGTIGYSAPLSVGTGLTGTVTAMADVGSVVEPGEELVRIDDQPVILLAGQVPAWRSFEDGMSEGPDVQQLERNLADLGYLQVSPDEKFTAATLSALKRWQRAVGWEVTGVLELGQIQFWPDTLRVQERKVALGSSAGPELLSVTGANRVVRATVAMEHQTLAVKGRGVRVLLPDGSVVRATITGVGAPEEVEGADGASLQIPVTLTLKRPERATKFATVPVTVLLREVVARNVLRVQVSALLAVPGGGFEVEVIEESGPDQSGPGRSSAGPTTVGESRRVGVVVGAFAGAEVAITAGKLAPGDVVVVAK